MPPVSRGFFIDTLLPLALFPALAVVAANTIFGHFFAYGTAAKLSGLCSPAALSFDEGSFFLSYTGITALDPLICGMVTFFHGLIDSSLTPLHAELFSAFGVIATVPFFEAARKKRHFVLALPMLVGLLYQTVTVGVASSVYWLVFILSGAASLHLHPSAKGKGASSHASYGEDTIVTKSHAEAILFGTFVGYIIPTAGMLVLVDPYVTAIWQIFPVWMSISQLVHRMFRRHSQSGHLIVRNTYFFLFLAAFLAHSIYVWPLFLDDHAALQHLFLPSMSIPSAQTTTLEQGVLNFTKWDSIFAVTSTVLATFWFAGSTVQFIALALWYVIAFPFFGPGAAIAGVFLWREDTMNGSAPVAEEVDRGKSD